MFKRKIKKLIRDPKLFLHDLIKKQEKKINTLKKTKLNCGYKFTIVSAVYNAEPYLDDFLKSLINQSVSFKKHIKVILVNDGSSDKSADIISKWCKKYPHNILGLYKENGGQATARNLGLTQVDTEWVGFIDPDDFVNKEYFSSINTQIEKNKAIDIVSCKMIVYKEESKTFADTQPLRFCFEKKESIRNCNELDDLIQLSASSALFKTNIIKENDISFNHQIKPNFEDGKFVIDYMTHCKGKIAFLSQPNYYYRVRGDNSSTTNTQWEKEEKYSDVLEHGLLAMLQEYHKKNNGNVPRFAQRTALYFLIQYFNRIINNGNSIYFLTNQQKKSFLNHLDNIFNYIDDGEILKFNLLGAWFFHKVGMQAIFKSGNGYNFQIAYIKNFDEFKNEIQISYFCHKPTIEEIKLDGKQIIPHHVKTVKHDFLGRTFVERLLWVSFEDIKQSLSINLHNNTDISVIGNNFKGKVTLDKVKKIFSNKSPTKLEDKNNWLFMDSDTRADDNAEHLYRYVTKNHPNISTAFVLRKNSSDWSRLNNEGFNLVEFDTPEFKEHYEKSGVLLSSHIDKCFTQYNGKYSLVNKKFIFLQHGITKDDISSWLNNTCRIDGILTSTYKEHLSLTSPDSPYNFDSRNVILTGMPRYDSLISNNKVDKKSTLLIMPTWRRDLAGKTLKNTSGRSYNSELKNSEYFKKWQEVINSDELNELRLSEDINVVFMPHPNLIPYINDFVIPEYIQVIKCSEVSVQELVANTKILITDYSSIAFDVALVGGKCIYYQFDESEVFSGKHTYSRGYYDYHTDGFGPVVYDKDAIFIKAKEFFKNNDSSSIVEPMDVFSFIDEKNCERAFSGILTLLRPAPHQIGNNINILYEYAQMASSSKNWQLALERWQGVISGQNESYYSEAKVNIINSQLQLNMFDDAINTFSEYYGAESNNWNDEIYILFSKINILSQNWYAAANALKAINEISDKERLILLQCFAEQFDLTSFESVDFIVKMENSDIHNILYVSWRYVCLKQWSELIVFLEEKIASFHNSEHIEFKPYLILSRAYQEVCEFDLSNTCLQKHESFDKGNIQLRYQIASLANQRKQWVKVTSQLSATNISIDRMPFELLLIYIRALRSQGKSDEALNIIQLLPPATCIKKELVTEIAEIHFELKNWNLSAENWMKLIEENELSYYKLAFIYRRLGMIEEGLSLLLKKGLRAPLIIDEWLLRAELAELSAEWDEATYCWSAILRYHSDDAPSYCWDRLSNSRILSNMALLTRLSTYKDDNKINRM